MSDHSWSKLEEVLQTPLSLRPIKDTLRVHGIPTTSTGSFKREASLFTGPNRGSFLHPDRFLAHLYP
jgi:hypothetical protein